jgi:hypothetical protein
MKKKNNKKNKRADGDGAVYELPDGSYRVSVSGMRSVNHQKRFEQQTTPKIQPYLTALQAGGA